jgi:hypothetical protein
MQARSPKCSSRPGPHYAIRSLARPVTDHDELKHFPGGSQGDSSARSLEKLVVENARCLHPGPPEWPLQPMTPYSEG